MSKLDNILVYHWHGWKGFLISHLVADYCQVEASYEDAFSVLESRLTPNIKAVLLQINLTDSAEFPAQRNQIIHQLQKRHIKVLNPGIDNIQKTHLHYLLKKSSLPSAKAKPLGPDDEWLFVKSNLNWGGEPEQRLNKVLKKQLFSQQAPGLHGWDNYYRAKRKDIRPELWEDPTIVIEKYIENPEQSFYRLYCFGEGFVLVKAHSSGLVKKIGNHPKDQNFCFNKDQLINKSCNIPEALQHTIKSFITNIPIDYFCLDIVHDMKDFYIIDLNLTPYSGVKEQNSEAAHMLIQGALKSIKYYQPQLPQQIQA